MKKSATKSQSPPKAPTKAKPGASEAKPVKLLAGGNPQIAKAEGDPPCGAQKPRRSSYPCEYSPLGRRSRTPVFHMIWGSYRSPDSKMQLLWLPESCCLPSGCSQSVANFTSLVAENLFLRKQLTRPCLSQWSTSGRA